MTERVIAAIITSVGTSASTADVAITALVLNNKRFDVIEKRLDTIERKLELIQTGLKQFYKDIAQLRARTGLD
jgi:hypothetical protein